GSASPSPRSSRRSSITTACTGSTSRMTDTADPSAVDAQVRAATRAGLAVGLATAAYGVSFGALSVAAGLDVWQTCVLSLLMFTGGSQFALIGVVAGAGAVPSVAVGTAAITSAAL